MISHLCLTLRRSFAHRLVRRRVRHPLLLVCCTLCFDRTPFHTCVCHTVYTHITHVTVYETNNIYVSVGE